MRNLVELHGGKIRAESPGEGKGATFTVELPISPLAPQAAERQHPAAETANASTVSRQAITGIRILAVDDDADTLETIRTLLEQHGAMVRTALSAPAAVEIMINGPPT